MSLLLLLRGGVPAARTIPSICLAAGILNIGSATNEGVLIESVALPWFETLAILQRDPEAAYAIPPRSWEEIIAGAYSAAGFEEVVLTRRSGDLGRDVIATRTGVGSICIYDKMKAYKPGHLVTADEVRALVGVLQGNVSKGVVTTTSDFAPRLRSDPIMAPLMPHRLELKPGSILFPWLQGIAEKPRDRPVRR